MYIGQDLQVAYPTYKNIDDISGSFNGVTTSFALLVGGVAPSPLPLNSQQCLISVGGVIQRPDDTGSEGFRLSGGNIVFSSAPATGEDFFGVILAGADYVNVGANFPSGSAGAPSITFDSDLDTGIYNSAANQVSITTSGTERLRIDSAGQIEAVSLGTAAAPTYSFTTDTNTGIYSPGADTVAISTNGAQRVTVNSSGNVGIGTASPAYPLHVVGAITSRNSTAGMENMSVSFTETGSGSLYSTRIGQKANAVLAFEKYDGGWAETARIDSAGRVLVGTSTARSNVNNGAPPVQIETAVASASTGLSIINNSSAGWTPRIALGLSGGATIGSTTAVQNTNVLGYLSFVGADGTNFIEGARIEAVVDGTPGTNDMPGRLVFSTTADGASSPTERMRITNAGKTLINTTSASNNSWFVVKGDNTASISTISSSTTSSTTSIHFENPNGNVGSIVTNGSATAFNTASDYRLKENVTAVTDAITRLQQLKPSRFNFIADPGTVVDGFIAHEVQAVVPEAIHGAKDEVDADGNPIYQGIDQSKLVPLLTAALQEAVERIEQVETEKAEQQIMLNDLLARVTALETA